MEGDGDEEATLNFHKAALICSRGVQVGVSRHQICAMYLEQGTYSTVQTGEWYG